MELFDLLNPETGQPTGQTATREQVHSQGFWHASVDVWLLNSKKELLVQKRAPNKDSYANMWETSCSGHLLSGETAEQAALRELQEELGLHTSSDKLQLLCEQIQECYTLKNGSFINNEFKTIYLLHNDAPAENFQFNDGEVSAVKWLSIAELKQLHSSADFVPHPEAYQILFQYLDKFLLN